MVNHDQKGIKASGRGKIGDEVTRDLLDWARCGGANGGKWGNSRVSISLVLLASCATFDVFVNIGGQARPPKFSCNELMGFEVPGVTSSFVIEAALEDRVVKGVVIGDVDTALVG